MYLSLQGVSGMEMWNLVMENFSSERWNQQLPESTIFTQWNIFASEDTDRTNGGQEISRKWIIVITYSLPEKIW